MSLCCGLPDVGPPGRGDLIAEILLLEWAMFQAVSQLGGGRAACQENRAGFELGRGAQFASWPDPALRSYLADLEEARRCGRNLLAEKYARMMERTSPEEYSRLAHRIAPLAPEAAARIDEIVDVVLEWEETLARRYPHLLARGRPIRSTQDSPRTTSLETYLRGELATCSPATLRLYADHVRAQQEAGENGSERILAQLMEGYGFTSLDEANRRLAARR